MADTDLDTVDNLYGARAMTDGEADQLVDIANRMADDIFGGKVRTQDEVEGNDKDFKTFLAAHLWAMREGEAQSESQAGGTITYNVVSGQTSENSLSETRYGRMAATYLRGQGSFGVEIA